MAAHRGIRTNIRELLGQHAGEIIWVIASGPSMDFIPPTFFIGRTVVGVNQVFRDYPCHYVVCHHGENCQEIIDSGNTLVTSEFNCGEYDWGRNEFDGDYYYYRHADSRQCAAIDLDALNTDDSLAISASTTAEAVHFAAHLGASTIILCGCDSGRLDGKINYAGYNGGQLGTTNPAHLPMTEPLLMKMVAALRTHGRNVFSLNPFVNFGLEGHKYSRPPSGSVWLPDAVEPGSVRDTAIKPGQGV